MLRDKERDTFNEDRQKMMEILKLQGFPEPKKWVKYAQDHSFQRVKSERLTCCPDCSAEDYNIIGNYVYYSTWINLLICSNCRLVYSDIRLDPLVIKKHFEITYKDEDYFLHQRCYIFDQIARLVDEYAMPNARILDVGGAKGHLMAEVKKLRPDLNITINDLSQDACDSSASKYGFETITGPISEIKHNIDRFNVIVMSDVIYYEPELAGLWKIIPDLLADGGTVIIRIPNKMALMLCYQFYLRLKTNNNTINMNDRIKFFNPEHLYVFSTRFLTKRLKKIGFIKVTAIPSRLLLSKNSRQYILYSLLYGLARIVYTLSFGKLILTPSLIVVGRWK